VLGLDALIAITELLERDQDPIDVPLREALRDRP
jgi:hypothetical protein